MSRCSFGVSWLVLLCAFVQPAVAQDVLPVDPDALVERCIARITRIAEESAEYNRTTAARCVRHIHALLEAGEVERARRVARHCIRLINHHSGRSATAIRHTCRRCVRALHEFGAEDLAARVAEACERAIARVRGSQQAAIAAIEGAFPSSP